MTPNGLPNTSAPSTYFPLSSTTPGANTTHPVDPGAVLGLSTYANDANESDIEILTRDPLNRIRYMNQLSDNDTDGTRLPSTRRSLDRMAKSSH